MRIRVTSRVALGFDNNKDEMLRLKQTKGIEIAEEEKEEAWDGWQT